MTEHDLLIGLSAIIILGIVAQWLAWRTKMPAILLLLAFGMLAGPGCQAIYGHKLFDPDALLGKLLYPVVSLSVAIILFEGGLTLNVAELSQVGKVVRNLVSVAATITWVITSWAAWFFLGFPWQLAVLTGGILVVTGPTVIGPLLRQVRPVGKVGPTLKWEGIVIDPIGAMLAVLVFNAIEVNRLSEAAAMVAMTVGKTAAVGAIVGVGAAGVLVLLFRRYWVADYLQNPFSLMMVIAAFIGAETLQPDSGLLAVTIMGITLANQRIVPFKHILEFKESLSILLVSGLFIVLGSRLDIRQFQQVGWDMAAFVAVLIIVVRPVGVMASTIGSGLSGREKIFLCCIAPRGIVAAAVASVFALRLGNAGYVQADRLVPTVFAVIIATVSIYGLAATPLAKLLGLASGGRSGFLIAGASPPARTIATVLRDIGQQIVLVDTNPQNVAAARMDGFTALLQSAVSEQVVERTEGTGIGRLLALTPNEEANTLAAVHFARLFGRSNVFQLAPEASPREGKDKVSHELSGRVLFNKGMTYDALAKQLTRTIVKRTPLTDEFGLQQFHERYGPSALPLFLADGTGELEVFTADNAPSAHAGQTLIALVDATIAESAKEADNAKKSPVSG